MVLALSASGQQPPVPSPVGAAVPLLGLRENRLIRWSSAMVRSDTVFIAANVFPIRGDSLDARPAYLGRLRETAADDLVPLAPLELPPGDFQFAYPRIISSGGSLHLVWGEFDARPRTPFAWASRPPSSLWHAVLTNGSWSTPERIATASWFGWNDRTGSVAVDGSGILHVAAWTAVVGSKLHVNDFHLAGGHWETSVIPSTSLDQTTAVAAHGDTVVLALVAEVPDSQQVVLVESTDQGAHWSHPVVVSSRHGGSVSSLALAPTPDGQLLAIGVKRMDSFYFDTIRVIRVNLATGASSTRIVMPPPLSDGFVLAVAPCGAVVMLIKTFSTTPQVFELEIPRDAVTPTIRPLIANAATATFPGLASTRRSVIALVNYTAVQGIPAQSVAMSLSVCPASPR